MKRLLDWPERLGAFLAWRRGVPFAWGSNDCALFVADTVEAMTGEDPAAGLRGYDSEFGAQRTMMEFCGGGIEAVMAEIAEIADLSQVPPAFARRGDVVLVECAVNGHALGLIGMDGQVCYLAPAGMQTAPASAAQRAWRIPG
jgi:hypothetical protein